MKLGKIPVIPGDPGFPADVPKEGFYKNFVLD